jgi:ParB/RepB/Spo0J family partition protein
MKRQITVKLSDIDPNVFKNPRMFRDPERIKQLCASIKQRKARGEEPLMQPIGIVRQEGKTPAFALAFGWGRYEALGLCSETECVAIVHEAADAQAALDLSLGENVTRRDLTPVEIVSAVERYATEYGLSDAAIAAKFGWSISYPRNMLRIIASELVWAEWRADTAARKDNVPSMKAVVSVVRALPKRPEKEDKASLEQWEAARQTELKRQLAEYQRLLARPAKSDAGLEAKETPEEKEPKEAGKRLAVKYDGVEAMRKRLAIALKGFAEAPEGTAAVMGECDEAWVNGAIAMCDYMLDKGGEPLTEEEASAILAARKTAKKGAKK